MKLNKMREEMAQSFLNSLKEDKIPWRKEWSSISGKPFNAVTKTPYRGTNLFWLLCQQHENGFQDPRWCTFKQAKDKGWSVKKGEKGTKVEFWSMYDRKTKKKITPKEAKELQEQISSEEYMDRIKPISSVYTVFNGEQIEGIPEITIEKHTWNSKELMEKRDVLLNNMNVNFLEQGWEAYYLPARDLISLPEVNNFENEYAYFSTMLHEAAHATGHSSRFDRNFGSVGSKTYAKEELRAEIASAFTAQVLGIDSMNQQHMENHKAYVQNWIDVLENNPEELFAAIKEAEKISDYLIEKGEFDIEQFNQLSKQQNNMNKEYESYVREHSEMVKLATEGRTTIVINAFGGPGSGKTTSCMDICAELKKLGYNAEYVQEYAKELVYDKNFDLLDGSASNQFTILKEQMRRMDRLLGQTDFIVTDAPILLNSIYNQELTPEYENMISDLSEQYQNFSFFMKRDEQQFQAEGRIHNLEESKEKDQEIRNLLDKHHIYYGSYTHDTIGVVVKNAVVNYNNVQKKHKIQLSQQNNGREIDSVDYKLIQNVALMEEKLNIPADARLTKWNGDLALYESKMNISTTELQSTYEQFQQYHMPLLSVQDAAKVRLAVKGRSVEGYQPEPIHLKVAELVKEYQDSGMDTRGILSHKISEISTEIGVSDDKYTVNLVCSIAAKDRNSYEEYMKEIVNGDIIPEKIDNDLLQPKEQDMPGIFGEEENVHGKIPFPKDAMSTIKGYMNEHGKAHSISPIRMMGGLER